MDAPRKFGMLLWLGSRLTLATLTVPVPKAEPVGIRVPRPDEGILAEQKLLVVPLRNIPNCGNRRSRSKKYHRGYAIVLECDIPFYKLKKGVDYYSASLVRVGIGAYAKYRVAVRLPSAPYNVLDDRVFEEGVWDWELPLYVYHGITDACKKIQIQHEENPWKYLVLDFPVGEKYSGTKVTGFSSATTEMFVDFFDAGSTSYVYWVVVRTDIYPRIEVVSNAISRGAAILQAKKRSFRGAFGVVKNLFSGAVNIVSKKRGLNWLPGDYRGVLPIVVLLTSLA